MAAIGFAVLLRRRSGLRRGWLRTESHRPATSSASRASSTGPYEPFPVPSLWRRLHPECFSSQNAFHAQPGHEASGEPKHKRPEPYGEPLSLGRCVSRRPGSLGTRSRNRRSQKAGTTIGILLQMKSPARWPGHFNWNLDTSNRKPFIVPRARETMSDGLPRLLPDDPL